jgi:hypothetical protein
LPYEAENAGIAFEATTDAEEPTSYALTSGETYAFVFRSQRWDLNRSVARFQITVDNSQNSFPFSFLANNHEQSAEPNKSRVLTHSSPMSLAYDMGDGVPRRIYQTNTSNFRLVGRVKQQGEDRLEVVHETNLKVALGDKNRWVLVEKSSWQQIKSPALGESESLASSTSAKGEAARPVFATRPDKMQTSSGDVEIPPKLYVLAIGVSKYKDERYNLSYAHRDAEAFAELWKKQAGLMYREVEARVLTDERATRRNIESSLGWLEKQVTKRDNTVIMVSGHGMLDAKNRFYIATHDMDENNLKATCVPRSSLEDTLGALSGGQTLLFLDTCHSGQSFGSGGAIRKGGYGVDVLKSLSDAGTGVVVFTSSRADEMSLEQDVWGHGAFTKAFLDVTNSPRLVDKNSDGFLALDELDLALGERVKDLTGGRQHPSYDKSQSIKPEGRILRFP